MKKSILLGLISLFMISCGAIQDPDNWNVEIEDAFKAQVATRAAYDQFDEDVVDNFIDKLNNLADKIDENTFSIDVAKYDSAFVKLSKKSGIAESVYNRYQQINCDFSKFEKIEPDGNYQQWQATEKISGITVIFKINDLMDWELILNEDELNEFVGGEQQVSNYLRSARIIIRNRVEQVYNGELEDEDIMSIKFYYTFLQAQTQCEDETGWPDWDYWRCTQGGEPKVSITNVEILDDSRAKVSIDLIFSDSVTKVELPMVYENDDWFVDDIISHEDGKTYSLKKAAKSQL